MLSLGETVVGSSDNLSKKILPFDMTVFDLYDKYVVRAGRQCEMLGKKELENYFLDKSISIPFSINDLLDVCHANVRDGKFYDGNSFVDLWEKCNGQERCSEFVFEYVKYLVNNKNSTENKGSGIPTSRIVKDVAEYDIANIPERIKQGDIQEGDKIVTHGYRVIQLPQPYNQEMASYISMFFRVCSEKYDKKYTSFPASYVSENMENSLPKLNEDDVLFDLTEYTEIGPCIKREDYKRDSGSCDSNIGIPLTYYSRSQEYVCREKDSIVTNGCEKHTARYKGLDNNNWSAVFSNAMFIGNSYYSTGDKNCYCHLNTHENSAGTKCEVNNSERQVIYEKITGYCSTCVKYSDLSSDNCAMYCAKSFFENKNGFRDRMLGR